MCGTGCKPDCLEWEAAICLGSRLKVSMVTLSTNRLEEDGGIISHSLFTQLFVSSISLNSIA